VHRLRRAEAPLTLRFYNNLMWSYVRAGAPARAVDVFDDLPNPNVECYTTLVKALGALRRPREAVRLLGEMRARAVAPGLWTYNAVIAACVRGGRLDWAREVLAEMAAAGVRPNVVSWNTIIDWHARQKKGAGRLAGAAAAFAEMKAAGVQPNTVTYTTMMKSYAASGAMNKAEGIFAEMKKRFPDICVDVEAYNTLLAAHAARLDWRRCLELLDEMQLSMTRRALSASPAPDEGGGGGGERLEEYRPGDDGFGHGGLSRSASSSRNVLSSDDGLGARSGTGRGGPAGNMDIEQLLRVKPNAHSYALVIKGCADARRVEIAHTVFDEMLADGISPPPPHAVVSLLGGYASTGDFPRALSMLKRLKEWGIAPNLRMMCALMNSCLNAGEPDLALAIFAKVKASSTPPDVVAFTMLLKAYGMKGDLAKALNVVKAMTRDGATVRPNVVTYNALISCANENGRPDAALRALRMALDDRSVDIDDNTFHALVQRASVDSRRFTARGGGRMSAAAEAASVDVGDDLSDEEDALGAVSEGAESLRQTAADEADAENIMGQSAREYLDYLLAVVQIVREAGRAPNGTVYVALLEACEMCDDGDLGVKLVEDRQRGGFRVGRAFASEARLYEESMRSRAKRS
jgi:pentatricopeptide repeat protein